MVEINFFCFNYFVYLSISLRSEDPFCKVDPYIIKGNPTCEILVVNQCYLYPVCQGNTSKSVTLSSLFYFGVELH